MTQQIKYRFFEDDGHAWLEVPRAEVEASGMSVTPYSYYDPDTDMVYLEEDVDMINFLKAIRKGHVWRECISTTIRSSKPRQSPTYKCGETTKIAQLNDEFRKSGEGVTLTKGVYTLTDIPKLLQAVKEFNDFTSDNDPYGEHDFGSLTWSNEKVFWKIDYYDQNLKYGEDPLSENCRRVLVVMLASEY